ncbi:uncharacterized protein EAF02_003795 [Botrytis sinoallii]|uniref:uncharacterized protein n=1 Tax=Botrytis sinoallii TaxID=1463999 RepID=UPI0019017E6B|nr:uncharacterized protein EAF02_003795 [Botrytis sinoallii]KAF7887148.1 hypothetical protein EAF02_003795 [Botrytis sinoallii]
MQQLSFAVQFSSRGQCDLLIQPQRRIVATFDLPKDALSIFMGFQFEHFHRASIYIEDLDDDNRSSMDDPTPATGMDDVKLQSIIASIPEAFRLHGIWEPDDGSSDENSSDSEDMFSDTGSEDYDEEAEEGKDMNDTNGNEENNNDDEEGDDDAVDDGEEDEEGDNAENDAEDNDEEGGPPIVLFNVRFDDRLLCESGTNVEEHDECPNSILRAHMWGARSRLHLDHHKMGFLS